MVMAKIQGTIMGQTCTMLINNGSELNMMSQMMQAKLELPMDPSGKDWHLHRVSGHQVNLVGLCCDVPVHIGGVLLHHNFFITPDNIRSKEVILGQPWLFSYSARIDYTHGTGMNLQIWQDGDQDSGHSVQVMLPIMLAPRNVLPIELIKSHMASSSINSAEVEIFEPIPEFPSIISLVLNETGLKSSKLRPLVQEFNILNQSLHVPNILETLWRAYYAQGLIQEECLETQLTKVLIHNRLSFTQSVGPAEDIMRFILGNQKYKLVGRKVHPVASYNPDSCPLIFQPLNLGQLAALPMSPTVLKEIQYMT
jgi:Retroviral aspartyl protease